MSRTHDATPAPRALAESRRALIGASVGNATEWYDYAIYGASATALATALTPGGSDSLITIFAVLATACVIRPLGALVVGAVADRQGRQRSFVMTLLLMAVATALIGLIPPWGVIGGLAIGCLLVLRAVQAFSTGGEISASVTYVVEYAPDRRRGWYGGWYLGTVSLGLAVGIGVTGCLAAVLEPAQMQEWGWRIPFLLALPLGLAGLYIRMRLRETPPFRHQSEGVRPARARTILQRHRAAVLQCAALVAALSCTFNVWFVFLPSHLVTRGVAPLHVALGGALVGLLVGVVAAPGFGILSDRVGRRPVLVGATAAVCVLALPSYGLATSGSTTLLVVSNIVVAVSLAAFVVPSHVAEQFPVEVRATGVGLAYGVATAVVGGTAPLVATVLAERGPDLLVSGYVVGWAAVALVATERV